MKTILAMIVSLFIPLTCLAEKVWIETHQEMLAAHYLAPSGTHTPKGVVIFVHGDGAMSFDAEGYYRPIWNLLHQQGYAVLSWDKPGVGDSPGNWLKQSMSDRQKYVSFAIALLKQKYHFSEEQIGLMGFSQAGWVIPQVAQKHPDLGFLIGVGIALNWQEQSWYMTHQRLVNNQQSGEQIAAAFQKHLAEFELLKTQPDYQSYLKSITDTDSPLSEDRFGFILKNFMVDSRQALSGLTLPALVLLGKNDKNTDTQKTDRFLKRNLKQEINQTVALLPDATHALLKAPDFNKEMGFALWMKLLWLEEEAFADGFMARISEFLDTLSSQ